MKMIKCFLVVKYILFLGFVLIIAACSEQETSLIKEQSLALEDLDNLITEIRLVEPDVPVNPIIMPHYTIASSSGHALAIASDGSLWAWGLNFNGQLGNGTREESLLPIQIGTDTDWVSVAASSGTSVALRADGTLWRWGGYWQERYGRIRIGTNHQTSPVQMGTDTNWASIYAGHGHIVGIRDDGSLWAWGYNQFGQLGDGTTENRATPVQVGTDTDWVSVVATTRRTMAIREDGSLWEWGRDIGFSHELSEYHTIPVQVGTDTDWSSISLGRSSVVAIKTDGSLWAWGINELGQVGDGTTEHRPYPVQVGVDTDWETVATGGRNTFAIRTDGTLWGWGSNQFGDLGDGTTESRLYPVQIGVDTDWQHVIASTRRPIAIRTDGSVWSWGQGGYEHRGFGFIGDGTQQENRYSPVKILEFIY